MKFNKAKIAALCEKIKLSEPAASAETLSMSLTNLTEDIGRISNAKCDAKPQRGNALDFSALRKDLPVVFSDTEKLFDVSRETENNCLCIPKII